MTFDELQCLRRQHWAAAREGAPRPVQDFVEEFAFTTFGPFAGRELPMIAAIGVPPPAAPPTAPAAGPEAAAPVAAAPAEPAAAQSAREARLHAELESELAQARVLELRLWPGGPVYVPRALAGCWMALVGDRRPAQDYRADAERGRLSWLAADVFSGMLQTAAPATIAELVRRTGTQRTSRLAVARALAELAARLRVLRVGNRDGEELWQASLHALDEAALRAPDALGALDATATLLARWLGTMMLDTEDGMAEFFVPVLTRSRVHAAVLALQASRTAVVAALDGRPAFRLP